MGWISKVCAAVAIAAIAGGLALWALWPALGPKP
jgi:hypothetical protein